MFSTVMVHLEIGSSTAEVLRVARTCSAALQADVIGIAACQTIQIGVGENYMAAELIDQDYAERARQTEEAKAAFLAAVAGPPIAGNDRPQGRPQWRSMIGALSPAEYIARQARAADLIVTAPRPRTSVFDTTRAVDLGDLVLHAGRPVMIVPAASDQGLRDFAFGHALVAFKDTREARRAVADAVPLLRKMGQVTVVEVASKENVVAAQARVADVAAWLARHEIVAEHTVVLSEGDAALQLDRIARDRGTDLLVAGAYGHNRLREWALGGVTRDLLMNPDRCTFLSS